MQVSAEIHLGTRTVLEYLLSPVQKVAWSFIPSPSIPHPRPSPEWRGEARDSLLLGEKGMG